MILQELLDTRFTDFKVNEDNASEYDAEAKIGDRTISFLATKENDLVDDDLKRRTMWLVEFSEQKEGPAKFASQGTRTYHTYKLTGSGKEFAVFAFVKQCMEKLIEKHHPEIIKFTAEKEDGGNRAEVYEKMIKRFAKGYELKKYTARGGEGVPGRTVFKLEKI